MKKKLYYIILVITISILIGYLIFFKTEVTVEGRVEYGGKIVSSDIRVEDDYLSISSFKAYVLEDDWISNNEIVLKADHESEGFSNYKFNLTNVNLEKLDLELDRMIVNDMNYDVVHRFLDYSFILSKDNGDYTEFFIYKDEKLTKIDTLKKLDYKPILISKDNSKILYLDKDNRINTYNIESKRKKTSIIKFEEDEDSIFYDRFKISDDGGYFSYSIISEDYSESYFSIYGADTGRLYAKDIIGVGPRFSSNSDKVAFFYSGDSAPDVLTKSRIGVLSLKSKKINYYDRNSENEKYLGDIIWTDDNEKIVFTSKIEEDNYISILDISKMIKYNYNVKEAELDKRVEVIGNKIYWTSNEKSEVSLAILATTGQSPRYIEKLRKLNDYSNEYFIASGQDVYVLQGNYLIKVSDEKNSQVLYIDESTRVRSISPDGKHILIEKDSADKADVQIHKIN